MDDGVQFLEGALEKLFDAPATTTHIALCPSKGAPTAPPVTLLFARFREDSPDIEALAEFLSQQLVNYVIPMKRRKQALAAAAGGQGADFAMAERLRKEAKRKFLEFDSQNPGRASEVGELLAYLIALQWLGAFQVASKMALKTSGNMPVHGLDGIHAKFHNGVMTLYFLESKLAGTAAEGIAEFVGSTKTFKESRKQYLLEYSIIADLGNLDALDANEKAAALQYMDVYGEQKSSRLERSVGVICYSEKAIFKKKLNKADGVTPSMHEQHFAENYQAKAGVVLAQLKQRLVEAGLDNADCELFILAVPDKDELRERFNGELMA